MASFELFKSDVKITGKHARMAGEIWMLNDYEHTYMKRLIDLYILAAIVGFRVNRKAAEDHSPVDPKTIFLQQVLSAKDDLDFIMQMMYMLDMKDELGNDEAVKQAFRGPQTREEFLQWKELFNGYVRGGIEELYERLVIRKSDPDDAYYDNKTANLMNLIQRFGA